MKRKYAMGGFAVIASLAIVSPALGGPSLQSLVKKEVAKQLSAAQTSKKSKRGPPGPTGPAGPAGANGANGANGAAGANGSARAYALVDHFLCSGSSPFSCGTGAGGLSKGVTAINQTSASSGIYCVNAPGLSPSTAPALATVDVGESAAANRLVTWNSQNNNCAAGLYEFQTIQNSGTAANDVSFSFAIP